MIRVKKYDSQNLTVVQFSDARQLILWMANFFEFDSAIPHRKNLSELQVHDTLRNRSLTKKYGTGEFPLHTDFSHLPVPPNYIALINLSDKYFSRPTLVATDFLARMTRQEREMLESSIWILNGSSSIYATATAKTIDGKQLLRWDMECMQPVNDSAFECKKVVMAKCKLIKKLAFDWPGHTCLILDNWACLHGRGPAPRKEIDYDRSLLRLALRKADGGGMDLRSALGKIETLHGAGT